MNKFLTFILVLISAFTYGCSSSGSSKPLNVATGPVIASISPTSGGYGTMITINGSNFGVVQSTSLVSYAGVTVTPSSWSDTQIALVLPDNAPNNGNFVVVVGGVYSNSSVPFSLGGPVISYISPASGLPGSEVTISGQYFGTQNSGTYVTFNYTTATIKNWNNNIITCVVLEFANSQANSVSVVVWLDAYRYSNSYSFNITQPSIESVNPNTDNIGARITLTGQAFGQTQGTITVDGVTAQIISWSDKSVQFRIPKIYSGAGNKTIAMTVSGRQTNSSINVAAPSVTNYAQATTPISNGNRITIYGDYFGAAGDIDSDRSVELRDEDNKLYSPAVTWSDTALYFDWPVSNDLFGTQTVYITITVGGLSYTFQVTAE
ncbi:MAG: hypothetical protein GX569_11440 [Candidatus Riflebacteria bacterium]|nr:hypothetical protein [Candidatus Riflebacteria bacterium]